MSDAKNELEEQSSDPTVDTHLPPLPASAYPHMAADPEPTRTNDTLGMVEPEWASPTIEDTTFSNGASQDGPPKAKLVEGDW